MAPDSPTAPASRLGVALFSGFLVLASLAAWIGATGGVRVLVSGRAVSARDWWPAALAASALLALFAARRGAKASSDVRAVDAWFARHASACAAVVATATLVAGVWLGSTVAGGADSSGYLNQASAWRRGQLVEPVPTALGGNPVPAWAFSPLGHRPGTTPGTIVPSYPPGLPLQFALASLPSQRALALVVPTLAAAAVWCVFVLARRAGGGAAGLAAAVLASSSAIFLYQLVQPMSDVPVTAWWLVAFATLGGRGRRRFALSGLAAGVAIATRPNLAPALLAVPFFAGPGHDAAAPGSRWPRRAVQFAAGLSGPVILLAWFNTHLYGAPWASGYGDAGQLFSLSNVSTNLARYAEWLRDTQPFLLALALAGIVAGLAWPRTRLERQLAAGVATFSAVVAASYVAYAPFESWTYTRFLLPALTLAAVPAGGAWARAAGPLPAFLRLLAITAGLALAAGHSVNLAQARGAFDVAAGERRYERVAQWVREHTPADAIVLSVQHSGSLHHAAGRTVLRWDLLDASAVGAPVPERDRAGAGAALASTTAASSALAAAVLTDGPHGSRLRPLVVVVDADEEAAFRERFGPVVSWGQLDWPPRAATAPPPAARVYLVEDRHTYAQGGPVRTELLAGNR